MDYDYGIQFRVSLKHLFCVVQLVVSDVDEDESVLDDVVVFAVSKKCVEVGGILASSSS